MNTKKQALPAVKAQTKHTVCDALKKATCIFMSFIFVITFSGCSLTVQNDDTKTQSRYDIVSDGPLRDKKPLYDMYEPTEIINMYLTVSTGNEAENTNHTWEEINTYSAYHYDEMGIDRYKVAGLLQVGDENGPAAGELGYGQASPNCTVQIRGQSSSRNAQKNYKIKLKDNKGEWRGQTTIALNKHQSDGLRFRNKLCYDLISKIDQIMGLRTTFVRLYVKDTTPGGDGNFHDYGIYTQVEQLNKTALEAHGLDKNGHLYKINLCEFLRYEDVIKLKDDPGYDQKAFEELLEIKGDDDHQKLIDLLDKINDYSIPIETIIKENFDMENLTYWMAFMLLMGNIDTQNRNFYLYSPLNGQKWYILVWDNDGCLARTQYALQGRIDYTAWESGVSNYWGNELFKRCLKSPEFKKELDKAVEDLKVFLTGPTVKEMVNTYANLLKPYIYSDPDITYAPLTPEQYDTVIQSIPAEIEDNYKRYKDSWNNPMPFYIGVPSKTENGYSLIWDASFDFDAETVTYTLELATDCNFTSPILKLENIQIPSAELGFLAPGQYFVRVTAKNESGFIQHAFDTYIIENGKVYGTKCFFINADGTVTEDVYVET